MYYPLFQQYLCWDKLANLVLLCSTTHTPMSPHACLKYIQSTRTFYMVTSQSWQIYSKLNHLIDCSNTRHSATYTMFNYSTHVTPSSNKNMLCWTCLKSNFWELFNPFILYTHTIIQSLLLSYLIGLYICWPYILLNHTPQLLISCTALN